MIVSVAILVWVIPFLAVGVGYYYGRNNIDPDTLEGLYHYRGRE